MTDNTQPIDDQVLPDGEPKNDADDTTPIEGLDHPSGQMCSRPECTNKADWRITDTSGEEVENYFLCQTHALEANLYGRDGVMIEPTWNHDFQLDSAPVE